jgi:hypothetical protein
VLYFPRPYPEELLYSVLGRLQIHIAEHSPKRLMSLAFSNPSASATPNLPYRLATLLANVADILELDAGHLITHHTLAPYYAAYRSSDAKLRLRDELLGSVAPYTHLKLGLAASMVRRPGGMQFCPACWDACEQQYGEPCWLRVHQLPGVLLCPSHETPLRSVAFADAGIGRNAFLMPRERVRQLARPVDRLSSKDVEIALRVARASMLLLVQPPRQDANALCKSYRERLRKQGYGAAHVRQADIERQFWAWMPATLFERLFRTAAVAGEHTWMRAITRKPRKAFQPLQHLLFQMFLDNVEARSPPLAFGPPPWRCPNWRASHFGERVVWKAEIFRRKSGSHAGRFHCSCGFVFSMTEASLAAGEPVRIIEWGPTFQERAAELWRGGTRIRAIARELRVDSKTVHRLLGIRTRAMPSQKSNRLPDKRTVQERPGEESRAAPESRPRVDWDARDQEICARIEQAAAKLLSADAPVRVTRAHVGRMTGDLSLIDKKIARLPRTAKLLEACCESVEAFQIRRIRRAVQCLNAEQTHPARWRVMRLAMLREETLRPGAALALVESCDNLFKKKHGELD